MICWGSFMALVSLAAAALPTTAMGPTHESQAVTQYSPLDIAAPVGTNGETGELRLMIPTAPGPHAIASPVQLWYHIAHAWDVVVETNQAGLTDAKAPSVSEQPLRVPPVRKGACAMRTSHSTHLNGK